MYLVFCSVLASAEVGVLLQTQSGVINLPQLYVYEWHHAHLTVLPPSTLQLVQSCYETVNGIVAFSCGALIDRTPNTARLLGLTLILVMLVITHLIFEYLYKHASTHAPVRSCDQAQPCILFYQPTCCAGGRGHGRHVGQSPVRERRRASSWPRSHFLVR